MPTTYFALGSDGPARAALVGAGVELAALYALASARVEAAGLAGRVAHHERAVVLVAHDVRDHEVPERALAIERLATERPYLIDGRWTFLPAFCVGVAASPEESARGPARAIDAHEKDRRRLMAAIWGGSVEASRLHVFVDAATIGGDPGCEVHIDAGEGVAATLGRWGKHAYAAPGAGRRGLLLLSEPLDRPIAYFGTAPLYVPAASPAGSSSIVILFTAAQGVVEWARSGGQCDRGCDGYDAIARYRLTEALARRGSNEAGLVLVRFDAAAGDVGLWVARLAALPTTVKRSISCTSHEIAIVAEGPHDDLVVHGDQVREHFADRAVKVVDWIAEPNETSHDTFLWLRSRL